MKKKFDIGRLLTTASVFSQMQENMDFGKFVMSSLERYRKCDWGDTNEDDALMNDDAVACGDRILASYVFKDNDGNTENVWIITESDRSATTILFPHEY